jgi:hypothetical protein
MPLQRQRGQEPGQRKEQRHTTALRCECHELEERILGAQHGAVVRNAEQHQDGAPRVQPDNPLWPVLVQGSVSRAWVDAGADQAFWQASLQCPVYRPAPAAIARVT